MGFSTPKTIQRFWGSPMTMETPSSCCVFSQKRRHRGTSQQRPFRPSAYRHRWPFGRNCPQPEISEEKQQPGTHFELTTLSNQLLAEPPRRLNSKENHCAIVICLLGLNYSIRDFNYYNYSLGKRCNMWQNSSKTDKIVRFRKVNVLGVP